MSGPTHVSPADALAVRVRSIGPADAAVVLEIVRAAFGNRPTLDPPADADSETAESLAAALTGMGGLLAEVEGRPVASVVLDAPSEFAGSRIYLRRFGVLPSVQGHGIAGALVDAALLAAAQAGAHEVAVIAREELPRSVGFWRAQEFVDVGHSPPYLTMVRPLPVRLEASTPEEMHRVGERLARLLGPGDVVVLIGELGAGKTTLTQGLGQGLGVRGDVTSPALVHVDAYRLGGVAELDDLDLDTSLDEAVTVVEWGEGIAEGLSDSRLEVRISRATGADVPAPALADADGDEAPLDPRTIELHPVGPRWSSLGFRHPLQPR
jgi:tRNA threonylcarbamoyladenosine biosynthesis protein TsaE